MGGDPPLSPLRGAIYVPYHVFVPSYPFFTLYLYVAIDANVRSFVCCMVELMKRHFIIGVVPGIYIDIVFGIFFLQQFIMM